MTVPQEVLDLVAGSGNKFHSEVATWFQRVGWHVIVSPYYLDQSSSKAREIDLIAEKTWTLSDRFGGPTGDVAVRLFIECKFVPTYSVFWFADKDRQAAERLVSATTRFRDNNPTNFARHHYLSINPRVAKLFASSKEKLPENEPFYRALNQVLSAFFTMRGRRISSAAVRDRSGRGPLATLEFPVVICNSFGKLFGVDFFSPGQPSPIIDTFELEIQYAHMDRGGNYREEHLLLDFVDFNKLPSFMAAIDEDVSAAKFFSATGG